MNVRFVRRGRKAGQPPGTLEYVGPVRSFAPRVENVVYGPERMEIVGGEPPPRDAGVLWTRVFGVHETELIRGVGSGFGLSDLLMEDICHTGQRPKLEDLDDALFVIVTRVRFDPESYRLEREQISLVLGDGWVLTVQEGEQDVFEPIMRRLTHSRGRLRGAGADYLLLMLLDSIIDDYLLTLDRLGQEIEDLEETVLAGEQAVSGGDVYHLKGAVLGLRRAAWPLREMLGVLRRGESGVVAEGNLVYVRDIHDHCLAVMDTVESFRESLTSIQELTVSMAAMRLNAAMRVLTVIATVFIPLTFVAGVYGMNFDHMPELGWRFGYPAALGLMAALAGGMLFYFHKKHWL